MKICLVTHTFPRFEGDTSAPFMGELASALAKKGNTVTVLTPWDKAVVVKNRGFRVVTYKYIFPQDLHKLGYSRTLKGDKTLGVLQYILSPLLYVFSFLALLKLVRREKIDVISAHWLIPGGFVAGIVSLVTSIPAVSTIPGSDVYMASKNFFFRWLAAVAARCSKYVLSDSSHYLDQLHTLRIRPAREGIIRYGVNKENFKPTRKPKEILEKLGLKEEDKIVLAVGRMVAKKGFIYLVKAMASVVAAHKNCKLVLVGDGEERMVLEGEVNKLYLGKRVIFAGTINYSKLADYYNLADVFVMPSIRDDKGNIDASPVSMMEAMMCGAKIVATKFSGSKDLIVPGKTGVLVREKNATEIADAILKLVDGKNAKDEVRKLAVKNFSSQSVAQKYVEIFEQIKRSVE